MTVPKVSLLLGSARKPAPLPPTNGVKRSRSAFQDDDEELEEHGRSQKVSHFDSAAGGAIDESSKRLDGELLIIPKQANRDWKQAANIRKRQRGGLSGQEPDQQSRSLVEAMDEEKTHYGLNIAEKRLEQEHGIEMDSEHTTRTSINGHTRLGRPPNATGDDEKTAKGQTDDEAAMDMLLGRATTDKTLVVSQPPISESDAFRHDFADAPEMASLASYVSMPVDQFGAAMLRGMGWKDGEGIGPQRGVKLAKPSSQRPERRAALLGIGAKEESAVAQEMGAWGRAVKGGKGEVKIYNPVLLRDKQTGEMYTEDELKKKQEREEKMRYEAEFDRKYQEREQRRSKKDDFEARDKWRSREKYVDRHNDHRRSADGNRRRYEDESDTDYHRRKERERRRRGEEHDDRDDRQRPNRNSSGRQRSEFRSRDDRERRH